MLSLFYQQSQQISQLKISLSPPLMLTGLIALIVLFILDAYGWVLILNTLGHHPSPLRSVRIWMISSIARYIPGGVWSYISRADLARHEKIDLASLSISMWLEAVILASSSLAIGLPALMQSNGLQFGPWHALGAFLLFGLCMHPNSFSLLRFIPGRIGLAFATTKLPSATQIFLLYCYYTLFWCLFGLSFVVFAHMISPLEYEQMILVGSSISLGFFAGFIVLFVPSGIGVREATLYFLLIPHMPEAQALVLALSSRLWIMVGEIFSFMLIEILYWISIRRDHKL